MLINKRSDPKILSNETEMFSEGIAYINSSQWLLAYQSFKHLTDNSKSISVEVLYNMALCHFFAKEYQKTIYVLNEALTFLSVPSIRSNLNHQIPDILLEDEYQGKHYLKALTSSAVDLNHPITKLRIRRLLVDTHYHLENWKEIIRLSALPDMEKCENVRLAFAKAKENI
ncbi:hypothetical protein [Pedobacter punctiformis]|uniref:Tetratricopeptide repeat protein n=1 Tax=Pedobacter punctiformis TaxID=3004097 RepID=A0ABT4L5W2_9SPHI|nr:hypothetical protein [Pedobacter sp. HCMS5-2]MCZ4243312.1 hypothetical protein [Pedobacter sp. HCMS5-2]